MPTPLTPDEEFDALFRRGLEHDPEQPENPAAWHRMDILLDADLRQRALRRKVLRMLGAESVLLLLLLWGAWFFVAGRSPLAAGHGPATAGRGPAAAASRGPASTRSTEAIPASVAAASRGSVPPKTTLAEPIVPPYAAAAQPAGEPAAATKMPLAAKAAHNATAGRQRESNGQRLAIADTKRRGHPSRFERAKSRFLTFNKLTASNEKQHKTSGVLLAATAERRHSAPLLLAAERRRAKRLAWQHRRGRKGLQSAAAASTPRTFTSTSQSPTFAIGRRARQWPAAGDGAGGIAAAMPRVGRHSDATSGGNAIDPLAPRWPATDLYFALPDSLRPVVLATRPAPADSLLPRPQAPPYRLRLGLVAAPELSTVRTSRLAPPGPSVGVQLDYRLARRWRLSTAFLYSVKRYGAAGTDYTVPYTMPHGWVIDEVNAVCRIIDIPLNLRYDLWQRPRYQVFASAGLSSLLMKREQYTYDYAPVYGKPVAPYTFEVSNGSQHFLKVLNLSVGYERLLGPRWSVQAEPFVKLPLAGVGYGAVRLRSAGVFFSLRYGLLPVRPAPVPGLR